MRKDAAPPEETALLIARLRAVHLGILLLIALLAVFGQWRTIRALDRNRSGEEIADSATRIAVSSQTLVSYAQALADRSTSPWARQELREKLRAGVRQWDADAASLQVQVATEGATSRLRNALAASDLLRSHLAMLIRAQLRQADDGPEATSLAQQAVRQEEGFLRQFLPVTDALREISVERDRNVRLTILVSLVMTLMALGVEGFFIFRPMVLRVAAAYEAQRELQLTESLRLSEERLRAAIEGSFDAFFLLDAVKNDRGAVVEFVVGEANSIAEQLLGVTREALVGLSYREILPEALIPTLLPRFVRCMAEAAPFRMEIEVGRPRSRVRWLEIHVAPVPGGLAVTARDLTEHKRSEQSLREEHFELQAVNAQLTHMAVTDPLTGLFNRRALMALLSEEAEMACKSGTPLAVVMADLDDFKMLNDRYGHLAGDQVLKGVGEIIQHGLRPSDSAARYGGEEFAIILKNTDSAGAKALAERLRQSIEAAPLPHAPITLSLGIASWVPTTPNGEDLVRAADEALYEAKRAGKNVSRTAKPPVEALTHLEA